MAVDDVAGNSQQAGHFADLVLEQELERFDDPALRLQPLHFLDPVVVGLDGLRRAQDRVAFDHVGIQGALDQEIEIGQAFIKNIDEGFADDLALFFR